MSKLTLGFVVAALSLPAIARAADGDTAALLAGVTEIVAPGAIPGPVAVFGENAFVVMTGKLNGETRLPLVAASRYERGKVVALGHEGFWNSAALKNPDNVRFLANCVGWAAPSKKPRVAVVGRPEVATVLEGAGFTVERLTPAQLQEQLESPDFDVLLLGAEALDGRAGERLAMSLFIYVRSGGGLVMDSLGWGWLQLNPGRSLGMSHGGNKLFSRFGICWADGFFDKTGTKGWLSESTGLERANGRLALTALQAHAEGTTTLSDADLKQATATITATVGALPNDEPKFLPLVNALTKKYAGEIVPLPIKSDQPFARLRTILDMNALRRTPAERLAAHPASGVFPGGVDFSAPRLTETKVSVKLDSPGWHSLGIYAPPGDKLTVSVSSVAAAKGLSVRIGPHTDTLWHLNEWKRFPEISTSFALKTPALKVASAFGGTIFIDVPERVADGSTVEVTVLGGVAQPKFVRGQTTVEAWKTLRQTPGPWAELEGRNIILSVPSSVIRNLDDPEALMTYWDEVADHAAELYGISKNRRRPERYCVDKQISAGYMHSGYPIMTGDDVAQDFVTLSTLRGPNSSRTWGFYHELGHNHQRDWWTFDGTGEVTNNLLSLYGAEKLNRVSVMAHPALSPTKLRERLETYIAGGAKFEEWQSEPFLALYMYMQLKDAFGWEAFKRVFAGYETASAESLPKTEQEKRDQWMVRFSKVVNKNLGPFFVAWGVPTSADARNQIARLPRWMPKDFPKKTK